MLFFLRQSIDLKLQLDILGYKDQQGKADAKSFRSYIFNDWLGSAKQLLLSGPRGHLFYLYPTLCQMITCDDSTVVALIRDCLQVAGAEIGLASL